MSAGSFAGIEWVGMIGEEDTTGLILPYGLFSLGKSENNFTADNGAFEGTLVPIPWPAVTYRIR